MTPQYRNVECRRYDECLTKAAKRNKSFACTGCSLEHDTSGRYTGFDDWRAYRDWEGAMRLLTELFLQWRNPPFPVRKLKSFSQDEVYRGEVSKLELFGL